MNKYSLYEGSLTYDELCKISNTISYKITEVNSKITKGEFNLDNFLLKKGDKVYLFHKYLLGKNEMKKLSQKYEFTLVDNIKDANVVVFPSYKNTTFTYVKQKYKEKSTGNIIEPWYYSSKVKNNVNDYDEVKYIYSYHEKVLFNTEIMDNMQDKLILNENYFKYYHFLLSNPEKENLVEYDNNAILQLIKAKDQVNVDIALTILKNKNVDMILSELVLIYYDRNTHFNTKEKLKELIFNKIPFLKNSLDTPRNATLYSVYHLKRIVNILESNNIKFNSNYFLDEIKNIPSKYEIKSITDINMVYNSLLSIGIELSNDQLKQILFKNDNT